MHSYILHVRIREYALPKISKFQLISLWENFVETHNIARNSAETVPSHKISTPEN